jgi:hypothetical protein
MQETILTPREAEALDNHAEQQARAQLRGIRELLAALDLDWDRLEELRDLFADCPDDFGQEEADELAELEEAAGEYTSQEDAEEALYNDPLDIEYRSGWGSTREDMQPEEFYILLCTGGPAVRIMGELDFNGEPHRAWIEFQDWGTPWTMLFDGQDDALDYAQRLIQL